MMAADCAARLRATRKWLDIVVLGSKLCPFAPPVASPPRLRLRSVEGTCHEAIIAAVAHEASVLRSGICNSTMSSGSSASGAGDHARGTALAMAGLQDSGEGDSFPETTLLVLERTAALSWPDLLSLSWRVQAEAIVEQGHAGELQLVLFHPEAALETRTVLRHHWHARAVTLD